MLKDNHSRIHNYLRISLTERCNLRCTYCMPENGIELRDKIEFMTQEETLFIAKKFVELGVTKIRLTGGEPLIKKNFTEILNQLSKLPVELAITTNGILLDRYWQELKNAGLKKINISLDSLQKNRVNKITRRDYFQRIMDNIQVSIEKGFEVKLNCVLMNQTNDDEIIDFVNFGKEKNVGIRFIEFMPFDGNKWDWSKTVSYKKILHEITHYFGSENLIPLEMELNGTARNFKISGFKGNFGVISSVTNPFCDSCNRIRLTADGKIKNCLFSGTETDLLSALRGNKDIVPLIHKSITLKHKERGGLAEFHSTDFEFNNRSMIRIGG